MELLFGWLFGIVSLAFFGVVAVLDVLVIGWLVACFFSRVQMYMNAFSPGKNESGKRQKITQKIFFPA